MYKVFYLYWCYIFWVCLIFHFFSIYRLIIFSSPSSINCLLQRLRRYKYLLQRLKRYLHPKQRLAFSRRLKVALTSSLPAMPPSPIAGPPHPQPSRSPTSNHLNTLQKSKCSTTAYYIPKIVFYDKLTSYFTSFLFSCPLFL